MDKILTELTSLKNSIENIKQSTGNTTPINCPCDNSKIVKEVQQLRELLSGYFPIDFNPIYNKIDGIKLIAPTISEIKEIITNNNNELISKFPKEKPAEVKQEPKKREESEWEKIILSAQESEELKNLITEIKKLPLTDKEKELADLPATKQEAERLQNLIRARIERENREKEKRVADIIFNNDKKIVGRDARSYYNSLTDFRNDFQTNRDASWLLYKCKSGIWGLLFFNASGRSYWVSSSRQADYIIEIQEIRELAQSLKITNFDDRWGCYEMNREIDRESRIKYSLMWSLANIRKQRSAGDDNWIKTESNWLPQIRREFAEC